MKFVIKSLALFAGTGLLASSAFGFYYGKMLDFVVINNSKNEQIVKVVQTKQSVLSTTESRYPNYKPNDPYWSTTQTDNGSLEAGVKVVAGKDNNKYKLGSVNYAWVNHESGGAETSYLTKIQFKVVNTATKIERTCNATVVVTPIGGSLPSDGSLLVSENENKTESVCKITFPADSRKPIEPNWPGVYTSVAQIEILPD